MPEKTKTGKWIFPIRDSSLMKKEGWFTRDTNTKGVSVRLARLKSNDTVVVQAYIFDTKNGWDKKKAEEWLKSQDINWIASLEELGDILEEKCKKIVMVISGDDIPEIPPKHNDDDDDDDEEDDEDDDEDNEDDDEEYQKKVNNNNVSEEIIMAEQKEVAIAQDGDARERVIVETEKSLPTEIVKVPKRIVTHRSKKKGSNGKPLNLNGKDYGKKNTSDMNSTEVSNDLNKCDTDKDKDEDKMKNKCGSGDNEKKDKKKMVRTPKKK